MDTYEVLDSRGLPTLKTRVWVDHEFMGEAMVPAGASRGRHEAVELRDGGARWMGKGVSRAVENVKSVIAPALINVEADVAKVDNILLDLDGTENKSKLGANAILSVSLATARAIAAYEKIPLYYLIGRLAGVEKDIIPTPMVNIISGGHHAAWNLDIQDLLIIPIGAKNFVEALENVGAVYHNLKQLLMKKGLTTLLADEGGFSPDCRNHREAIELILAAVEETGLTPKTDIALALDVAASHLFKDGSYMLSREGLTLSSHELVDFLVDLCETYPIVSVEDGCGEDDLDGWQYLFQKLSGKVQIVGDDLFATNVKRIRMCSSLSLATASLIKPNQVGTLTETLEAIRLCKQLGIKPIVSARSGDTEDSFIADLAVGAACPQIKIGSIARSERTVKYNRLLEIEREQMGKAVYMGEKALNLCNNRCE